MGTLQDGKSWGFWVLLLATPYRGRAIPCSLLTYSSKTIAASLDSRNLNHLRAFAGLKDLLGERPLVLDREFSYLELLLNLAAEQVNLVIRLNLGSHSAKFLDADGREMALSISPGETVIHPQVWYKAQVCVNLTGNWHRGFTQPLWVMTNLEAQQGLRIYLARMKIDESCRGLKSLLGMTKLMNKHQQNMAKMLAMLLLVYAIGLLLGEGVRAHLYGKLIHGQETVPEEERIPARLSGKRVRNGSAIRVCSSCSSRNGCSRPDNGRASLATPWLHSPPWFSTLSHLMSKLQSVDIDFSH